MVAREKVKSIDADLGTWTSQEVRFSAGKRLGSVGYNRYNPNIPHLQVGYFLFTNHVLTSWDIQHQHLTSEKGVICCWEMGSGKF